jgi:hypothetical protein
VIRQEGARRLLQLVAPYSAEERESWTVQMNEAAAFLADPAADTPMLTAMATSRGITVADLASRVWENTTLYRQAAGTILGHQQYLLDLVASETDIDKFLAISW